MDEVLKNSMENTCKELGISMTSAFTMFATKVSKEKRIPFDVAIDPFYSDENMARLRKSIAQMEATGGTVHEVPLDD
jgi:DNA-damage-inducible protein J